MHRCHHIQGAEKEYGIVPEDFFSDVSKASHAGVVKHQLWSLFFSHLPAIYARAHFLDMMDGGAVLDIWLKNAGRFYIDRWHPEYSTPECATARDAVIWQKAGDRIMADVVEAVNQKLWAAIQRNQPIEGITEPILKWAKEYIHDGCLKAGNSPVHSKCLEPGSEIIRIYRNSIDMIHKNIFGDHGNYTMHRSVNFEKASHVLLLHLISCPVWQGSGVVVYSKEKRRFEYWLSQRELCTGELIHISTTANVKPLLNTRDESHANEKEWYRIHIVGQDANMAEVATRLKHGIVMLLTLMLEGDFFKHKNLFYSPVGLRDAYEYFCRDLTFRKPYSVLGGQYSALDLQTMLLEWAEEYFAHKDYEFLNDEIQWQLTWWRKVLDCAAGQNPMAALFYYADHAAKFCLIENDMERFGYSWNDPPDRELVISRTGLPEQRMTVQGRLCWWDLEYHRISHRYGIFQKLPLQRVCTDAEIAHAVDYPPSNTRAFARRTAVDIFEENYPCSRISMINWERVDGILPGKTFITECKMIDQFQSVLASPL